MNEYRPISAESEHNFHILPNNYWANFHHFITRSWAISEAINACIRKTLVYFVSEHESEKWRRLILTLAKIAQN